MLMVQPHIIIVSIQSTCLGGGNTSVVVQWLRLHVPSEGVSGWIPGQGTRSHMLQLSKTQYSQINILKEKYLCQNKKTNKQTLLNKHQFPSSPAIRKTKTGTQFS